MGKSAWRSAWTTAIVALACVWICPGCAHERNARILYLRGDSPRPPVVAIDAGVYTLYPTDSAVPRFSIYLKAGDSYGFRRSADDSMVAVAKDTEIELGDHYFTGYYWLAPHPNDALTK